jgi:hypothetical protein
MMLLALVGVGGARISLAGSGDSATVSSPASATVGYRLTSGGDEQQTSNGGAYVDVGDWVIPKIAAGADYEVRATATSGTPSTGTTDSWLALSATQTWTVTRSSLGTKSCTLTIEVRNASTLDVLASTSITLTATVESGA